MTDSFQDWMVRQIRDVLGRHNSHPPFIVWCDPDLAWLDLLHECSKADSFELWAPASVQEKVHELLIRDRFFSTPRAPRVVWLPCSQDEISWFKPYELEADDVWEKSLLQALREYGVDISRDHEDDLVGLLPAHAREWFDKPKETWKELTPGNAKGTLVDDHRMLQVLGGPVGEMDRLREDGRFDIFARRATEDFGLPAPKEISEEAWRIGATARLLCTEAADGMPHEPPREGIAIIPAGLTRTHSLKLLNQWQNDIRYIASFERLVPEAEKTVGLTSETIRDDDAFHDRWHAYLPGWEMAKLTPNLFTKHLGFIADYIAEIFHNQLRPLNFTDAYERYFTFGKHVGHRDRKAVMRTVSGLIKLLHPDGEVSKDELAEYLTFGLEMRRRVKEQLRRINPTEFANVDLTYIDKASANR